MEWGYKINEKNHKKMLILKVLLLYVNSLVVKLITQLMDPHYSITPPAMERTLVVP